MNKKIIIGIIIAVIVIIAAVIGYAVYTNNKEENNKRSRELKDEWERPDVCVTAITTGRGAKQIQKDIMAKFYLNLLKL